MRRFLRHLGFSALLGAAALATQTAAARPKPLSAQSAVKRIAVAEFDEPADSRARKAVVMTLSDHTDIEVVLLEDIEMARKRIGAGPSDPAGRRKLSKELEIDGWVDGKVDGDSARVTLRTPDGRTVAVASLTDEESDRLEGLIGERVWTVMGVWLSSRELRQRTLDAQYELALKKLQAREQEMVRQRERVQQRIAERDARLQAARLLAKQKRAAYTAELERQRELVAQRDSRLERERDAADRRRAAAEEAEFMASLQESAGPSAQAASPQQKTAAAAQPAAASQSNAWAAPAPSSSAAPAGYSPWLHAPGSSVGTARTPEYATGGAPSASQDRPSPNADGLSPATRRWLAQQREYQR